MKDYLVHFSDRPLCFGGKGELKDPSLLRFPQIYIQIVTKRMVYVCYPDRLIYCHLEPELLAYGSADVGYQEETAVRRNVKYRSDFCLQAQQDAGTLGIVELDLGRLANMPLETGGVNLQDYFSPPAGRDGPVVLTDRAASTGDDF